MFSNHLDTMTRLGVIPSEGLQEPSEPASCGAPRASWVGDSAGLRLRGTPCRPGVVAVQEGGCDDEGGSEEKDTEGMERKKDKITESQTSSFCSFTVKEQV